MFAPGAAAARSSGAPHAKRLVSDDASSTSGDSSDFESADATLAEESLADEAGSQPQQEQRSASAVQPRDIGDWRSAAAAHKQFKQLHNSLQKAMDEEGWARMAEAVMLPFELDLEACDLGNDRLKASLETVLRELAEMAPGTFKAYWPLAMRFLDWVMHISQQNAGSCSETAEDKPPLNDEELEDAMCHAMMDLFVTYER